MDRRIRNKYSPVPGLPVNTWCRGGIWVFRPYPLRD